MDKTNEITIEKSKIKCVVFDLDGTLLNTLDDLANATNFALTNNGCKPRKKDEVRRFVGNGIKKLVERALGIDKDCDDTSKVNEGIDGTCKDSENIDSASIENESKFDKVYDDFCEYYKEHCFDNTKAYDGVIELLAKLKENGLKVAIVSNKADFAVQELKERYFASSVDVAVGAKENIAKKPSPDTVNEVLKRLEIDKENAVYVGDSDVDVDTARNAEIDVVSVTWGFRDVDFLKEHGAKVMAHNAKELENILLL